MLSKNFNNKQTVSGVSVILHLENGADEVYSLDERVETYSQAGEQPVVALRDSPPDEKSPTVIVGSVGLV